jgi:hypothetical protein
LREEFAGMVGTFSEYQTPASDSNPGFEGATEIIDHEELYARLARGQDDVVATNAFLRARLLDILIGDFDRHRKQWRWAKLPGDFRWQPIPEDRDMAFVRFEGAGPKVASIYVPILQDYGPRYPRMIGLTMHGWEQDRWLLPHASWSEWEAVARDMQSRLSDEKIEEAIAALPPEYAELDGERLRHDLRGRRDRLVEGARRFYEHLAGEVDVQASDAAEEVSITREPDGLMLLEIRAAGSTNQGSAPYFSRRFDPGETREVRLYLRGGDDRVEIKGSEGRIRLRVIAGDGRKRVDDRAGGGTFVYDEMGDTEVLLGPGTFVDRRSYAPPEPDSGFVDVEDVPPRDWTHDIIPIPQFGYEKDVGAFLGAGVVYTRYGFRRHPWAQRHRLTAGGATEAEEPRVRYRGQYRFTNSRFLSELDLKVSGIEILRFYGFGNNTDDDRRDSFYRVRNQQFHAIPSATYSWLEDTIRLKGGPVVRFTRTKDGNRKIDEDDPYGAGKFGLLGAYARVQLDTRGTYSIGDPERELSLSEDPAALYPTSGFLVDFMAEISPPVWDVTRTWGAIEGSIASYWSVGENDWATLAIRVGGRDTYGRTPYFRAAFIGGGEFFSGGATVRGLRAERFAGESSVYGNLDLRVVLGRVKLIVPGDFGVLGFADVGRVFEDGESSEKWHPGYGAGIWFAPLARSNAIRVSAAHSEEEDVLFYMGMGFAF